MAAAETLVKPPKDYTLEDAKKFMEKAKGRLGENKFQSFRDHLEEFLDNSISFQKLLQEMCVIFHGKPDLLEEFVNRFVPRGISMLEDEMKQPTIESKPRPKSRRPSYVAVAFVGGIGFVLGVWAHLLF